MELRFHGSFPPAYQDVPGTIAAKPKPETEQDASRHEPLCLLQCWTEIRDGKTAYVFLMYALQSPPHVIAQCIARYFHITPARGGFYDFIEVTPPNHELLRPVFSRFRFTWKWQPCKWTKIGNSWIWQDAGQGIVLPYSESELRLEEEAYYTQQLASLLLEAEQQEQQAALPQSRQRLLLPVFTHSGNEVQGTRQLAIEENVASPQS